MAKLRLRFMTYATVRLEFFCQQVMNSRIREVLSRGVVVQLLHVQVSCRRLKV
jgi:hypothetical protein